METVITVLIVAALLILSIVGLSQTSISTQASIAESSGIMQERTGDRARTNIVPLSAETSPLGDSVSISLKNTGTVKLADFVQWDVILQYSDGANLQARWYAFGSGSNEWTEQIYQSAASQTAEVIEPGILNPGEEMVVTVSVSPNVGAGSTNLAVVSTPNGITATSVFTH
jgi:hypothetical protein